MCTYLWQFILDVESFMIKMERINNIVIVKICARQGSVLLHLQTMGRSLFAGGSRKLSPPSADIQDLTIRYSVAREARGTAYGITSL